MPTDLPWSIPPGLILLLGGLLLPLWPGRMRRLLMLILPLLDWYHLTLFTESGAHGQLTWLGQTLVLAQVDALALFFGYAFHLAIFIHALYALDLRDAWQPAAGLAYAGSAIGAVFAGDLLSLFVYWELTAITSVFLVWARRSPRALRAGMHYLLLQLLSGLLLLAGSMMQLAQTGSLLFTTYSHDTVIGVLLLLAFGIKAAFPLLHGWLVDAYPEATVAGSVFLSAFTTKLAIYALIRGFAGDSLLIGIGAVMIVTTLIWAALEDDLRRVLSYALINQLGLMVVAIGIGTPLALAGAVAHALSHILYLSLLLMAIGAVLLRTGTARISRLGGLAHQMPWTAAGCVLGTLGMATPGFAGYVSKSLILSAAAATGQRWLWLLVLLASGGVFLVAGVRVCYYAFWAPSREFREVSEAPLSLRIAMGLTALYLLAIGVAPQWLYALLPYPVHENVYGLDHVLTQLQLLLFVGLGFDFCLRRGWLPDPHGVLVEADWLYRYLLPTMWQRLRPAWQQLMTIRWSWSEPVQRLWVRLAQRQSRQSWPTGTMMLWVAVLLAAYLILYFI